MNPKLLLTCIVLCCWQIVFAQSEIKNPLSTETAANARVASLTVSSVSIGKKPASDAVEAYTYDSLGNLIAFTTVHQTANKTPTNYLFTYEGSTLRQSKMSYVSNNYENYTITDYDEKGRIALITDSALLVKLIETVSHTYYQYNNDTTYLFTIDNNGDTTARQLHFINPIDSSVYSKNLLTNMESISIEGPYGSYENRYYKNGVLTSMNKVTYNEKMLLTADLSYYNNYYNSIIYSENPRYVIEHSRDSTGKVLHHVKTMMDIVKKTVTTITYKGGDSTIVRETLAQHMDECMCDCVHGLRYVSRFKYVSDTLSATKYSGDYLIQTYRIGLEEKDKYLVNTISMSGKGLPKQEINYFNETITNYTYNFKE